MGAYSPYYEQSLRSRWVSVSLHPLPSASTHQSVVLSHNRYTGYRSGNALTTSRVKEMLPFYQPRTELGRRLLELRRAYISKGGRLLSVDEVEEEVHSRRGGAEDA
ncbi:MAG: hypothetical protein SNJ72_06095 [Fimbriimonadales bacterium]